MCSYCLCCLCLYKRDSPLLPACLLTFKLPNRLSVVKISFLLQYRRIFASQKLHRLCFWLLIFVGVWIIVQIILLTMACIPRAELNPNAAPWCIDTLPIWDSTSIISLFVDFAIFLIPVPCIWNSPIPPRQKAALFAIFGLGFL